MSTLAELREMSNEDLAGKVTELNDDVFRQRLKPQTGREEDYRTPRRGRL